MINDLRDITADCHLCIDKEGRWFYEGRQIINPHVLRAFWQALGRDEHQRYHITIPPEICYIEVEETPFVVVAIRGNPDEGITRVMNDMRTLTLEPERLRIGKDNVMYVRLPDGEEARFVRPAYYTLALMMEEDPDGGISLRIGQKRFPIQAG